MVEHDLYKIIESWSDIINLEQHANWACKLLMHAREHEKELRQITSPACLTWLETWQNSCPGSQGKCVLGNFWKSER